MTDDTSFVPFWRFTAGLIAGLILVVPGQLASAALCTQWVSPTQATIGEIPVGFETLVPWSTDSDNYELRRQVVENYHFDVVALGPTGQRQTVDVAPDPDDPTVWRGSFSAATKGKWTIEVRNLESTGDSKCYTPLLIDVTEPGLVQNDHGDDIPGEAIPWRATSSAMRAQSPAANASMGLDGEEATSLRSPPFAES